MSLELNLIAYGKNAFQRRNEILLDTRSDPPIVGALILRGVFAAIQNSQKRPEMLRASKSGKGAGFDFGNVAFDFFSDLLQPSWALPA